MAVRRVLYENWVQGGDQRFVLGFVGGTDGHAGRPGQEDMPLCGMEHRGSVTGVVAGSLTRDALWTSLWERRTSVATTGTRTAVLLAAESGGTHAFMGEPLTHDGTVRLRAIAGPNVRSIELIVDGCLVSTFQEANEMDLTLTLPPGRHNAYVRVFAEAPPGDLRPAWSSPVYIDSPC